MLGVVLGVALASPAAAQGLGEGVFREGDWRVYRSVDSFTDEVRCTGTYGDGSWIQLASDADQLFVSLRGRGGLRGVTFRYGNAAPEDLRLPTDMEESLDVVIVSGSALTRAVNSGRLRLQILTILDTLVMEDIRLDAASGFVEARRFIAEGLECSPETGGTGPVRRG